MWCPNMPYQRIAAALITIGVASTASQFFRPAVDRTTAPLDQFLKSFSRNGAKSDGISHAHSNGDFRGKHGNVSSNDMVDKATQVNALLSLAETDVIGTLNLNAATIDLHQTGLATAQPSATLVFASTSVSGSTCNCTATLCDCTAAVPTFYTLEGQISLTSGFTGTCYAAGYCTLPPGTYDLSVLGKTFSFASDSSMTYWASGTVETPGALTVTAGSQQQMTQASNSLFSGWYLSILPYQGSVLNNTTLQFLSSAMMTWTNITCFNWATHLSSADGAVLSFFGNGTTTCTDTNGMLSLPASTTVFTVGGSLSDIDGAHQSFTAATFAIDAPDGAQTSAYSTTDNTITATAPGITFTATSTSKLVLNAGSVSVDTAGLFSLSSGTSALYSIQNGSALYLVSPSDVAYWVHDGRTILNNGSTVQCDSYTFTILGNAYIDQGANLRILSNFTVSLYGVTLSFTVPSGSVAEFNSTTFQTSLPQGTVVQWSTSSFTLGGPATLSANLNLQASQLQMFTLTSPYTISVGVSNNATINLSSGTIFVPSGQTFGIYGADQTHPISTYTASTDTIVTYYGSLLNAATGALASMVSLSGFIVPANQLIASVTTTAPLNITLPDGTTYVIPPSTINAFGLNPASAGQGAVPPYNLSNVQAASVVTGAGGYIDITSGISTLNADGTITLGGPGPFNLTIGGIMFVITCPNRCTWNPDSSVAVNNGGIVLNTATGNAIQLIGGGYLRASNQHLYVSNGYVSGTWTVQSAQSAVWNGTQLWLSGAVTLSTVFLGQTFSIDFVGQGAASAILNNGTLALPSSITANALGGVVSLPVGGTENYPAAAVTLSCSGSSCGTLNLSQQLIPLIAATVSLSTASWIIQLNGATSTLDPTGLVLSSSGAPASYTVGSTTILNVTGYVSFLTNGDGILASGGTLQSGSLVMVSVQGAQIFYSGNIAIANSNFTVYADSSPTVTTQFRNFDQVPATFTPSNGILITAGSFLFSSTTSLYLSSICIVSLEGKINLAAGQQFTMDNGNTFWMTVSIATTWNSAVSTVQIPGPATYTTANDQGTIGSVNVSSAAVFSTLGVIFSADTGSIVYVLSFDGSFSAPSFEQLDFEILTPTILLPGVYSYTAPTSNLSITRIDNTSMTMQTAYGFVLFNVLASFSNGVSMLLSNGPYLLNQSFLSIQLPPLSTPYQVSYSGTIYSILVQQQDASILFDGSVLLYASSVLSWASAQLSVGTMAYLYSATGTPLIFAGQTFSQFATTDNVNMQLQSSNTFVAFGNTFLTNDSNGSGVLFTGNGTAPTISNNVISLPVAYTATFVVTGGHQDSVPGADRSFPPASLALTGGPATQGSIDLVSGFFSPGATGSALSTASSATVSWDSVSPTISTTGVISFPQFSSGPTLAVSQPAVYTVYSSSNTLFVLTTGVLVAPATIGVGPPSSSSQAIVAGAVFDTDTKGYAYTSLEVVSWNLTASGSTAAPVAFLDYSQWTYGAYIGTTILVPGCTVEVQGSNVAISASLFTYSALGVIDVTVSYGGTTYAGTVSAFPGATFAYSQCAISMGAGTLTSALNNESQSITVSVGASVALDGTTYFDPEQPFPLLNTNSSVAVVAVGGQTGYNLVSHTIITPATGTLYTIPYPDGSIANPISSLPLTIPLYISQYGILTDGAGALINLYIDQTGMFASTNVTPLALPIQAYTVEVYPNLYEDNVLSGSLNISSSGPLFMYEQMGSDYLIWDATVSNGPCNITLPGGPFTLITANAANTIALPASTTPYLVQTAGTSIYVTLPQAGVFYPNCSVRLPAGSLVQASLSQPVVYSANVGGYLQTSSSSVFVFPGTLLLQTLVTMPQSVMWQLDGSVIFVGATKLTHLNGANTTFTLDQPSTATPSGLLPLPASGVFYQTTMGSLLLPTNLRLIYNASTVSFSAQSASVGLLNFTNLGIADATQQFTVNLSQNHSVSVTAAPSTWQCEGVLTISSATGGQAQITADTVTYSVQNIANYSTVYPSTIMIPQGAVKLVYSNTTFDITGQVATFDQGNAWLFNSGSMASCVPIVSFVIPDMYQAYFYALQNILALPRNSSVTSGSNTLALPFGGTLNTLCTVSPATNTLYPVVGSNNISILIAEGMQWIVSSATLLIPANTIISTVANSSPDTVLSSFAPIVATTMHSNGQLLTQDLQHVVGQVTQNGQWSIVALVGPYEVSTPTSLHYTVNQVTNYILTVDSSSLISSQADGTFNLTNVVYQTQSYSVSTSIELVNSYVLQTNGTIALTPSTAYTVFYDVSQFTMTTGLSNNLVVPDGSIFLGSNSQVSKIGGSTISTNTGTYFYSAVQGAYLYPNTLLSNSNLQAVSAAVWKSPWEVTFDGNTNIVYSDGAALQFVGDGSSTLLQSDYSLILPNRASYTGIGGFASVNSGPQYHYPASAATDLHAVSAFSCGAMSLDTFILVVSTSQVLLTAANGNSATLINATASFNSTGMATITAMPSDLQLTISNIPITVSGYSFSVKWLTDGTTLCPDSGSITSSSTALSYTAGAYILATANIQAYGAATYLPQTTNVYLAAHTAADLIGTLDASTGHFDIEPNVSVSTSTCFAKTSDLGAQLSSTTLSFGSGVLSFSGNVFGQAAGSFTMKQSDTLTWSFCSAAVSPGNLAINITSPAIGQEVLSVNAGAVVYGTGNITLNANTLYDMVNLPDILVVPQANTQVNVLTLDLFIPTGASFDIYAGSTLTQHVSMIQDAFLSNYGIAVSASTQANIGYITFNGLFVPYATFPGSIHVTAYTVDIAEIGLQYTIDPHDLVVLANTPGAYFLNMGTYWELGNVTLATPTANISLQGVYNMQLDGAVPLRSASNPYIITYDLLHLSLTVPPAVGSYWVSDGSVYMMASSVTSVQSGTNTLMANAGCYIYSQTMSVLVFPGTLFEGLQLSALTQASWSPTTGNITLNGNTELNLVHIGTQLDFNAVNTILSYATTVVLPPIVTYTCLGGTLSLPNDTQYIYSAASVTISSETTAGTLEKVVGSILMPQEVAQIQAANGNSITLQQPSVALLATGMIQLYSGAATLSYAVASAVNVTISSASTWVTDGTFLLGSGSLTLPCGSFDIYEQGVLINSSGSAVLYNSAKLSSMSPVVNLTSTGSAPASLNLATCTLNLSAGSTLQSDSCIALVSSTASVVNNTLTYTSQNTVPIIVGGVSQFTVIPIDSTFNFGNCSIILPANTVYTSSTTIPIQRRALKSTAFVEEDRLMQNAGQNLDVYTLPEKSQTTSIDFATDNPEVFEADNIMPFVLLKNTDTVVHTITTTLTLIGGGVLFTTSGNVQFNGSTLLHWSTTALYSLQLSAGCVFLASNAAISMPAQSQISTINAQTGQVISTLTVPQNALVMPNGLIVSDSSGLTIYHITADGHIRPGPPDNLPIPSPPACRNDALGLFILAQRGGYAQASAACNLYGAVAAVLDISSIGPATVVLLSCGGFFKHVYIGGWNTATSGTCLALYSGATPGSGAIASPYPCDKATPILCRLKAAQS